MEKLTLFDKFIRGELTPGEQEEFEKRLKLDPTFSEDFSVYSALVAGICREASRENADFGKAMKRLSQAQLLDIMKMSEGP